MPHHRQIKSAKQRQIEEEFDCSFYVVLLGFAEMGYGCDTTAKILEYDPRSFRALLKRRGWKIQWPRLKDQVIMAQRGPHSEHTRRKLSTAAKHREAKKRTGECL